MAEPRLAVIVPTIGRGSVGRARDSIMAAGFAPTIDVELVVADRPAHNDFGGWARNFALYTLADTEFDGWVCYLDDDDAMLPGALDAVRAALADRDPARPELHVFRARINDPRVHTAGDGCLWIDQDLRVGNVTTSMLVHSLAPLAATGVHWRSDVYENDFSFAADLVAAGYETHWHRDVIAVLRPAAEEEA